MPQQTFPTDNLTARWLIPVGFVRWVVDPSGGGYFVDRNIDPNGPRRRPHPQSAPLHRRITEAINGSDGALVLRNRTDNPNVNGRFQARLQSGDPLSDTLRDLVWVEGNLRSVGDIRMAGGALRFADINGSDQNTPLSIERVGDKPLVTGQRSLDALIGPDAQADNRFASRDGGQGRSRPRRSASSPRSSRCSRAARSAWPTTPRPMRSTSKATASASKARTAPRHSISGPTTEAASRRSRRTSDFVLRATGGAPTHNLILNPDSPTAMSASASPARPRLQARRQGQGHQARTGGQRRRTARPQEQSGRQQDLRRSVRYATARATPTELLLTGRNGGIRAARSRCRRTPPMSQAIWA